MNANEYQQLAHRNMLDKPDGTYTDQELMTTWYALGLAGEAGEVVDEIKKMVFHRHGLDRDKIVDELGDVLWYVAAICSELNVNLEGVMARNITKIRKRYPDGYSSEASKVKGEALHG